MVRCYHETMTLTLGDILHIVALLIATGGLIWRMSALASDVRALQKAIEKADPHVMNMPLFGQRLATIEAEHVTFRERMHKLANDMQYALGRLDDLAPREPSRPDLTETPGRYPPRR